MKVRTFNLTNRNNNRNNMRTIHSQIRPGKILIIDSNLKPLNISIDNIEIKPSSLNKTISYNPNAKGLVELEHYIRNLANTIRMTGSNQLCLVLKPEEFSINISIGLLDRDQ
jgi:hypothetical protein